VFLALSPLLFLSKHFQGSSFHSLKQKKKWVSS